MRRRRRSAAPIYESKDTDHDGLIIPMSRCVSMAHFKIQQNEESNSSPSKSTKNIKLILKNNMAMITSFCLFIVLLTLVNVMDVINHPKVYSDCHDVLQDGKGPGVYQLNFNNKFIKDPNG